MLKALWEEGKLQESIDELVKSTDLHKAAVEKFMKMKAIKEKANKVAKFGETLAGLAS